MAAPVNKAKFTQDINAPIKAVYGGGLMFSKDNLSNVISVDIVDNGQPFEVTGTVSGTVIRSDGTTVPVNTGAISGNTVSLTLTEACFDVSGQIVVNIIVTNGDVKCCVLRAVYTVVPTETSAVVDPGDILPSIADLINDIDAAVASIPADYSGLLASIAGTFSPSKPYVAGEYVWNDGTLYRFNAAHAAGSWTGSEDATAVTIGGELADLKSAITPLVTFNELIPYTNGAYILCNQNAGEAVSLTPVTDSSWQYAIVDCSAGDTFHINAQGANSARSWAFVDVSNVMIDKAVSGVIDATIVAPTNSAKLIINNKAQGGAAYKIIGDGGFETLQSTVSDLSDTVESIKGITTDYSSLFVQRYSITTNGNVGDPVSIEPQQNDAYAYVIAPCASGDQFTLTATGGATARVWCFVDKDYKKVRAASVIDVSGLALTAEKDGYLIVNALRSYGYSLVKIGVFDPSIVQSLFNSLDVGFILPRNFYGITGNQLYWYTPEMFSNWRHLLNYEVVTTNVTGVQSIEDSVAPRMIVPLQTRRLNIRLHDYANNEDEEKFIELKTASPVAASSASVLVIGDSFIKYTWGQGVLKYISDFAAADNVTLNFVGTTTTGYGYHAEARGGWSAVDYLTHYVPVADRDPSATDEQKKMPSPFVFSDNDTVADAYFDFAKYLTVNNMEAPDIIMISLGMNGGDTSAAAIQEMITDIHADYPNIRIIVSMIPTVPRRIETGDFYTRKTIRENQNLSYIALFDKRDAEKIYLSSEHLAIDGILGLGGTEQNVSPVSFDDSDKVMEIVNNSIHPTAIGAWNLAKFKYNVIVYVMNMN